MTDYAKRVRRRLAFGLMAAGALALDGRVAAESSTKQRADFSADVFLIGTWDCKTSRGGKPAGREEARYEFALDGRWLKLNYTIHPLRGAPISTEAYETLDKKTGLWTYISMRSDGSWGVSYSRGWIAGTKIYMPPATSPQTFELVATKLGQNTFAEEIKTRPNSGDWKRSWFMKCDRIVRDR